MTQRLRFIIKKHVLQVTGQSNSGLYERIAKGLFVKPVKLGSRSLWPEHEVQAINRAVLAGARDDELRELIRQLHEARKEVVDVEYAGQQNADGTGQ